MASDIVITPNRGSTSVNAKIDFTGASTASSQIRLEVLPDNSLSFVGTTGSLFSIADSVTGSLMSVNDASGLPILEVFDTDKVVMGQYNQNTLVVNGTNVGIGTGSPNSKLEIRGGTANQTYDATVYITADNDNDWGITIDKNRSLATEYGLKISTGSAASYALAVYGGGSLSTRIAGNGDIYAPRVYDSTATAYYVDPGSTSNLNGLTVAGTITGSISGNAGTVTNGVYTSGTYADPGWITSLAKSKVGLGNVENTALSSWTGSSNITTLGTIGTGIWNGTIISPTYGGTGINNGLRTLTINTNAGTIAFSTASTTLTVANNASVSGTNTGDQTTVSGNAGTATTWQTARTLTIGATGKSVNGSADVSWSASEIGLTSYLPLAGGTLTGALTGTSINTSGNVGIGMGATAPSNRLHIQNTTTQTAINANDNQFLIIENVTNAQCLYGIGFKSQNGFTQAGIFAFSGTNGGANGDLRFYTRNTSSVLQENMRLSDAGVLTVGGNTVLNAGNYNSYSPTLTGTGASGTWGISITGNAATATSADQIDGVAFRNTGSNAGTAADSLEQNGITYVNSNISLLGQSDGALFSQAYNSNWQHQIYGDYRTGQIVVRGKNNGTWQSWRTVLDSSNYTSYTGHIGNGTLTLNTSGSGISGSASFTANQSGNTTFTVTSNATAANTTNTIVYRDGSGNFSAGQITGSSFIKNSITVPGVFIQSGATSGAPSAIQNGDLWWNTDTGKLKIYWSTASAWVDATPVPDMAGYYTTGGGNINGNVNVSGLLESTGNITARIGQTYPVSIGSHPSYSGANYGALWRPGSNPVLLFDASNTYVNAPSLGAAVSFQVGNTTHAYVNSNGVTTNGSFIMSGGFTLSQNGAYGQTNNWIHLNGYHGLYSSNNSAHIYPNNNSSYGSWGINGSRNSYGGIYDAYSGVAWMHDSGGNGGLYKEANSRWYIYYNHSTNNCLGIGSSATTSGYVMQVNGNSYVTGYERVGGGNLYIDGNYGRGVVGLYASTRYQGVFAMGDSYKLADDGTTTGTLYGIAWSHPNAGGVAANLNTHGALVMENGTFLAAISGSIRCRDDMRAPIFYDSNDTNYYVDPASTSRVNTISFVSGSTFGPYFQYGNVAQNLRLQGGGGSEIGISGYDFNGNWRFQLYGQSGAYGFLNGNWAGWDLQKNVSGNLYLNNQTTYYIGTNEIYYNRVYGLADIRSPIFYDNDNTAYYCNPAGTSQFLQLDVVNSIGASDDVRSGTRMYDSAGMAAGVGGQLVLGYKYTATGNYTEGAILKTYKINATDGNYGSGLKIQVRNHGENLATKVQIDGSGNMVIGGNMTNNSYNAVSSTRLLFGGGNEPNSYFIGTNLDNYGGNYTKLDLRWHTGIRMGAQPSYGGIRIFSNEGVSTRIASFGETDSHVRIDNNLYVGQIIDISNSTYYVDPASSSRLNGGIQLDGSLGVGTAGSGTAGEIRATNNITAYYSDDRLKTKLGIIENPIEKVKALSGFYFEANETAVALGYQKKREVGVSAQEVQAILPEIIAPAPIDDKYMTVRYEKLIPLLIEAIKAQQAQIEELQKLIKEKV